MKKIFTTIIFACSFSTLVFAVTQPGRQTHQGTVLVEPLPCLQLDQKLVCFDGEPTGTLTCNELADNTILCSTKA